MKDTSKTKKQLIEELKATRKLLEQHKPGNKASLRYSDMADVGPFSYKTFYEFSPLMYFTLDVEGTILAVNPTGAKILGYYEEELIGESVLNVFHPEDRKGVLNQLTKCIANPETMHMWELRKVKKDGTAIWVRENAKVVGESGQTIISIVCEDITEQKQAEHILNTEKKVFERIARNTPLSEILEFLCLKIEEHLEGALCSFLVLDEEDLTLRPVAAPSLPPNYVKEIDGLKIGPCVGCCGTAAYLKEPVISENIDTDPLWEEYKEIALGHELKACWSTPIISSEDKVLGTFAMYYHVPHQPGTHEKKVIESAVHLARMAIERRNAQELASRFGEILEASLNEIYVVDIETDRFLQVNKGARKNLGYTMDELREMTPLDINPELTVEDRKRLDPLISGETDKIVMTSTHKRKDGTIYPVEIHGQISKYDEKYVFIANIIDITEREKTEEQLQEKVEQLSKKNRYESIIRAVTESVHESLDLEEVFDNAVDALNKYVDGAEHVVIFMVEGNDAVLKANRGHSEEYIARLQRIPYPKGATWKTITEGIPRYIPDTETDDVLGPAGKEFGTKSYLSMPIRSGEKSIGCIHIHSQEKDRFSEDDLDMLLIVARQLESAINNARQAEALKQSREDLQQKLYELSKNKRYEEIINTVTSSIHSSIDLQQVLENAARL